MIVHLMFLGVGGWWLVVKVVVEVAGVREKRHGLEVGGGGGGAGGGGGSWWGGGGQLVVVVVGGVRGGSTEEPTQACSPPVCRWPLSLGHVGLLCG